MALALVVIALTGCVVTPSVAPNGRRLFVPTPSPRSGLADTGEVPVEVSGENWGADQSLVIEQCASVKGEPSLCEQIGSAVTGPNGSFPLTTVTVHYLLTVDGTSVPCDAEVDPDPALGVLGAFFGGVFYKKHCSVRVSNSLEPGNYMDVWIAFAGHET